VARTLAAWHAAAPRGPQIAVQGSRDALTARWQANIEQARASCGHLLQDAGLDETERLAGRFTAGRAPLFNERIAAGRVVDGQGDLLADDIFCLDDGVRILDCLEFDDRLRWLDGLGDASFLAMGLERLGAPDLARRFTRWYAEYSGDPAPAPLRHHYVAYRAFVRAKVACLRARAGDGQAAAEAWQLAGMTLDHLRAGAVTLVLAGGLPGTGKTTLAGALADRLGFTVLSSDRIRKELAHEQIDRAALPPEGMPKLQRQLQAIRRELANPVSPPLTAELRRILPPQDEAPSAGALRIQCAVHLSWADSLAIQLLSELEAAREYLLRPPAAT
jgi:hypothetical protein